MRLAILIAHSSLRSATTTPRAPSAANRSARARPIPLAPPVTTTDLPCTFTERSLLRSTCCLAWSALSSEGSAGKAVLLENATADDHLLDLGGALADQEHRGLAIEALDLELLGEAVAAVDAEGVLDDLLAVLRRQVLGHARLQVVAEPRVLLTGGHHHHLVRRLDLRGHLGQLELDGLVLVQGL